MHAVFVHSAFTQAPDQTTTGSSLPDLVVSIRSEVGINNFLDKFARAFSFRKPGADRSAFRLHWAEARLFWTVQNLPSYQEPRPKFFQNYLLSSVIFRKNYVRSHQA
jgi:hypothetical protein